MTILLNLPPIKAEFKIPNAEWLKTLPGFRSSDIKACFKKLFMVVSKSQVFVIFFADGI
jgi:hypothetical protein